MRFGQVTPFLLVCFLFSCNPAIQGIWRSEYIQNDFLIRKELHFPRTRNSRARIYFQQVDMHNYKVVKRFELQAFMTLRIDTQNLLFKDENGTLVLKYLVVKKTADRMELKLLDSPQVPRVFRNPGTDKYIKD